MNFEFSKAITELRKNKQKSQRSVAQELGISQALLSHYENGVRQPKLAFVRKIAQYYGVSADELLGTPSSERQTSEAELCLLSDISAVINLVYDKFGSEAAELSCVYLSAVVKNIKQIAEDTDCPYNPRRYSDIKAAETALYDSVVKSQP